MKKIYMPDTNLLIDDPYAIRRLRGGGENDVFISWYVANELDNLKKRPGFLGAQARLAIKIMEEDFEDIVRFDWNAPLPVGGSGAHGDQFQSVDDILSSTFWHVCNMKRCADKYDLAVFVSNDRMLRLKVLHKVSGGNANKDTLNYRVEDYKAEPHVDVRTFRPLDPIELSDETLAVLASVGNLVPLDVLIQEAPPEDYDVLCSMPLNKYYAVRFYSTKTMQQEAGIIVRKNNSITFRSVHAPSTYLKSGAVKPKNIDQLAAMDALQDNLVACVALTGRQGTGKTFLAMSSVMDFLESGKRIVLTRATVMPRDHDAGFLPGTLSQKMDPWLMPFRDALDALSPPSGKSGKRTHTFDIMQMDDSLEVQNIGYVKGRSFTNTVLVVDEAQDLTRSDMKKLITRLGEGSRAILLGDLGQIDRPNVSAETSGLSYLIDRFSGDRLFAHVHFTEVFRSDLARLAVEKL